MDSQAIFRTNRIKGRSLKRFIAFEAVKKKIKIRV